MKKLYENHKYHCISVISVIVFLILWWMMCDVFGVFRTTMLPSPITVAKSFVTKLTSTVPDGGTLGTHIYSSLVVVLTGYFIGIVVGIPTGIFMAWYKAVDYLVRPLFDFVRTIPGIAWIPVITVWLGIDLPAKAAIIFINVFAGTVVNVYSGIKQTDEVQIWVAQIFGASRMEILRRVALPSALPYIFTGLKVSLSMAWLGIIAAELLAARSGLGYMIQVARNFGRADLVLVGMLTIGLLGAGLTLLLEAVERIFVRGRTK
ncbi:ABC transporter permease [Bengtsoniella intestinalis]|uniref:ABC transporter permease n=1 Tax=Bengtsoniella intestinalis TaxID=3073143 RepID=UPI00391F9AE5